MAVKTPFVDVSDPVGRADRGNVPRDTDLRTVALDPRPGASNALRAVRTAALWRRYHATSRGTKACALALAGDTGIGKSCALAWSVVHHWSTSLYVTASTVVTTGRNGFSENLKRWDRWLSVDLLALDDVGFETGDVHLIGFLLTERYNNGLWTLISTNISQLDFVNRYSNKRLSNRLDVGQTGDGQPWYVDVSGPCLRDASIRKDFEK